MTDQEISVFITNNSISLEEVEDDIKLSFVLNKNEIDEEYEDVIFPGDIVGTLTYDKITGEFDEFSYKISNLAETYDEQTGSFKTANMVFECTGKTAREPMGDMYIADDPTVYDNVINFLEDVSEQVVPPSIL